MTKGILRFAQDDERNPITDGQDAKRQLSRQYELLPCFNVVRIGQTISIGNLRPFIAIGINLNCNFPQTFAFRNCISFRSYLCWCFNSFSSIGASSKAAATFARGCLTATIGRASSCSAITMSGLTILFSAAISTQL